MMSRVPLVFLISLAACGSGNSPLFGGFTPTDGAWWSSRPPTAATSPSSVPRRLGFLIDLTTGANACNVLTLGKQCGSGSGSTTLRAGALSGVVGGSSVPPAGPGQLSLAREPPSGTFKASTTTAAQLDASCTAATGSVAHMTGEASPSRP